MAFDVTNFEQEVIAKSYETPVLVDFWAPWCGPCRVLGPVLEKLADENEAAWTLAKVNTDENPTVSMQYGIRGIPAVKLFIDGEVVNEFTGALPEYAVRRWLEEALPNDTKDRLTQAEAALEANQPDVAEPLLRAVLADDPDALKARALLARILVFNDPEEAAALVQGSGAVEPSLLPVEESIQTIARLAHLNEHPDELPDEAGKPPYLDAVQAIVRQSFDTAVARLIDVLQTNRYYDDDGARKAGIAIFTLLGNNHPVTRKHRRTFDMWLY
jgi:putative thioredoxin